MWASLSLRKIIQQDKCDMSLISSVARRINIVQLRRVMSPRFISKVETTHKNVVAWKLKLCNAIIALLLKAKMILVHVEHVKDGISLCAKFSHVSLLLPFLVCVTTAFFPLFVVRRKFWHFACYSKHIQLIFCCGLI